MIQPMLFPLIVMVLIAFGQFSLQWRSFYTTTLNLKEEWANTRAIIATHSFNILHHNDWDIKPLSEKLSYASKHLSNGMPVVIIYEH